MTKRDHRIMLAVLLFCILLYLIGRPISLQLSKQPAARQPQPIDYAYTLEPFEPLPAVSYGLIDTTDLSGQGVPASLLLTVYSAGPEPLIAIIRRYSGEKSPIALPPLRIKKLLPHKTKTISLTSSEENVGLYSLKILNGTAGAYLTRRSGDTAATRSQIVYVSKPVSGSCNQRLLPISGRAGEITRATVANVSSTDTNAVLQVLAATGQVIHREGISLQPREQTQFQVSDFLAPGTAGSFHVLCKTKNSSLLVGSTVYGGGDQNTLPVVPIVCSNRNVIIDSDTTIPVQVTPSCTQLNGLPLYYSRYNDPLHGILAGALDSGASNGTVNYVPEPGFVGDDSFTLKVTDPTGENPVLGTVTLNIVPSPR